jgi:DNA repair exonuclease SbcCD ATPase subunit
MNHARARGPTSTPPPPTSDKAIERFPTFVYTSEQEESMKSLNEFSEMGCSICISDFARDEVLLSLPCQHSFHKERIIPWLHQHNTCPVCRYELPVENEQLERERIKRMTEKFTVEGLRIMEIGAEVNSLVPSIQKCKHNFDEFCRRCNEAEKNDIIVDYGMKKQFLDKLKRKLSELENVLENKLYQLDELQQFKEERIKKQRKLQIVKIQSMQQIISTIKSRIAGIIGA